MSSTEPSLETMLLLSSIAFSVMPVYLHFRFETSLTNVIYQFLG